MDRARSLSDGPPKSNWSVCRPQVVWTLTVGEVLTRLRLRLVEVLRREENDPDDEEEEKIER